MPDSPGVTTFLFTDIEGSTRLWEREPERMHEALARHDAFARASVEQHRGTVVKMTGDGVHASFADPLDALRATLQLQLALEEPGATGGIPLRVRCGLHAGVDVRRDNDYYGNAVNRRRPGPRRRSNRHGRTHSRQSRWIRRPLPLGPRHDPRRNRCNTCCRTWRNSCTVGAHTFA